ncbi:MAG: hypothetical protein NDJ89_18815 [Oligoflexia bacterium]|nr:hypothetical protein [Oligoflexia bacterium]
MISSEDLAFLREFHLHFRPKIARYLRESEAFRSEAAKLRKKLQRSGVVAYFNQLGKFFAVEASVHYTALYLWWPPLSRDYAWASGDQLLLFENPGKHLGVASEDVVLHEVVHTLSSRQSREQKRRLTDRFLAVCPLPKGMPVMNPLEEPLAVVFGQMLFLNRFDPARFRTEKSWYRNEWIDAFARAIFAISKEALEKEESINDGFISRVVALCKVKRAEPGN